MARASYKRGVEWIAHNDEPDDVDADSVSEYITTSLLADLFDKSCERVARDVVIERMKEDDKERKRRVSTDLLSA